MNKFLGSVTFAIILISSTALFVIVGTFIESYTQSHQHAASITYHNPIFYLLLLGFFVNILFSALRRLPFHKKHIPFLMTHLGLLMIITGIFIKTTFGIQGNMVILEGSASQQLILPNTEEIHVSGNEKLTITREHYFPHSKEHLDSWIKGNYVFISGLKPWPIDREIPIRFVSTDDPWLVSAKTTNNLLETLKNEIIADTKVIKRNPITGMMIDQFPLKEINLDPSLDQAIALGIPLMGERALLNDQAIEFKRQPRLTILRDDANDIYIIACGPHGAVDIYHEKAPPIIAYNEAHGGYATQYLFPYNMLMQNLEEKKKAIKQVVVTSLREAKQLSPPLQLFKGACYDDVFPVRCVEYLSYLNDGILLSPELARIMQRIEPDLPPQECAKLLEMYFRMAEINPEEIFKKVIPPKATPLTLEVPLTKRIEPLQPSANYEENIPSVFVKIDDERIALSYDHSGMGLQWPVLDGKYLVSFGPKKQKIPYKVRLHSARQINYANSSQAYSYEADLTIADKKITLSMNNVYETWDGYRFYLAGMSPISDDSIYRTQIVVNHDPAKYFLTYPGGILVALGSILLFLRVRK